MRVRRAPRTNEIWPGFVDALSTLLMVIIFLLVAFMLAQYFLTVALSGRDQALDRLNRQVSELADLLSLERKANAELRLNVAQLSSELQSSTAERDALSQRLATAMREQSALQARLEGVLAERDKLNQRLTSVLSERDALDLRLTKIEDRARAAETQAEALRAALAEANKTIKVDRETLKIKLAELASLRQDIAALRKVRAELEGQVSQLAAALDQNREKLAATEKEAAKLKESNRVLVVDLSAKEAALTENESALTALREDYTSLRDRAKSLEAKLADEAERTTLAQKEIKEREVRIEELRLALQQSDTELASQRKLTSKARAQVELLNRQIAALRNQLARIEKALQVAEAQAEEQKTVIANLGKRLNLALAGKVEELQRYRSEFFGRLRKLLGNRPGIRVEGDRFVFQSEVLFASGSAELGVEGQAQLGQLADTLLDLAANIPKDLPWILRVDGHTDKVPIHTAEFPSNWELSTARAISVVRYLISRGVPANRLAAAGFGEFQPIDPRDDEIALRRNRRIELKLTTR